jgi:ribose transport system ATP-binding protein
MPSTTAPPPLLEVRGLCKKFPGVVALDHVEFSVYPHEVHALSGENGAGKSTLMKILGGALAADAGEILVEGQPVKLRTPLDSRRQGINQVPQDIGVMPNLSAAENIHIGAERRWGPWLNWGQTFTASAAALEQIGARFDPRTPVWQLSPAQQQLVVIARAIARDGRVLVLDEPTSHLGGRDCEKLLEVICELRESGMAIVYISHRLNEIYSLSDRITVLHEGHVMGTLAGEDISTRRVIGLMSQGNAVPRHAGPQRSDPAATPQPAASPVAQALDLSDGLRIKPATFALARGEIVGLTGLVGSGRSRLCRLLCGAEPKRSGSLRIDGREVDFRGPAQALRAGVVYVPEAQGNDGLFPRMSPQDNITLGLVAHHRKLGLLCDDAELARRCEAVMVRLRIELPADGLWASELSGGTRQKLALARGLVMQPKLLILDEPLKGLDARAALDVDAILRELASQGVAILWVASDAGEIVRVCDRALVMCEGAITGAANPAEGEDYTEEVLLSYATGIRRAATQTAGW